MNKKEQVTKYLIEIERLLHKMIDEEKTNPFTAFDLIVITIQSLIKESKYGKYENL